MPDPQAVSTSTDARSSGAPKRVALVTFDDAEAPAAATVRAAIATGLDVVLVASGDAWGAIATGSGARLVPIEGGTGLNPMKAGYAAGQLSGALKALEADIVHAVGLRAILVAGTAAAMAGIPRRVYSVTGLDAFARRDALGGLARTGLKATLRGALASRRTCFLFESAEAARTLGLDPLDTAVRIVGGSDAERARGLAEIYAELRAA